MAAVERERKLPWSQHEHDDRRGGEGEGEREPEREEEEQGKCVCSRVLASPKEKLDLLLLATLDHICLLMGNEAWAWPSSSPWHEAKSAPLFRAHSGSFGKLQPLPRAPSSFSSLASRLVW